MFLIKVIPSPYLSPGMERASDQILRDAISAGDHRRGNLQILVYHHPLDLFLRICEYRTKAPGGHHTITFILLCIGLPVTAKAFDVGASMYADIFFWVPSTFT